MQSLAHVKPMLELLAQIDIDFSNWHYPLSHPNLQIGTLTCILVGMTCGILGCFVILRRMALIGDALSHAILPGVVIAFLVTGSDGILGLFLGALLAGLTTTVLINIVNHHSRTKEDSAIGIVFTALFAVGLILISSLPRGTHFDLKCFIIGAPEAVGTADLLLMSLISVIVIALVVLFYHRLKLISFDPVVAAAMGIPVLIFHYLIMGMISATVVAGLKTTGVVLVVAMVITPASAAYQLTNRFSIMLILSGLFGALSAVVGMILAYTTGAQSGPAMVLVATFIFVLAMCFGPKHGVLFDLIRRVRLRGHVESEDVLKRIYHLSNATMQRCQTSAITSQFHLNAKRVAKLVDRLIKQDLLGRDMDEIWLTDAGLTHATEMVRAHRLWESYLTERAQLDPSMVHGEAERLEHAHELADEVDRTLGHPELDPHGQVIPRPERPNAPPAS
jgi:ABC-type Mn2+/Zn2+ transport system permease subunit/Mn-dependent DtxR family transcriptional regulator